MGVRGGTQLKGAWEEVLFLLVHLVVRACERGQLIQNLEDGISSGSGSAQRLAWRLCRQVAWVIGCWSGAESLSDSHGPS